MTDHALSRDEWPEYWKRRLPNSGVSATQLVCQCHLDAVPFVIDWNRIRPTQTPKIRLSGELVVRVCAEAAGITMPEMFSYRRQWAISRPRQVAAYMMTKHCKHLSFTQIGKSLGGRDHSTVSHALNRVQEDLAANGELFGDLVAAVETRLGLR